MGITGTLSTSYYVYELVLVPDGNVIYVGKGHKDRMVYHRKVFLKKDTVIGNKPFYCRLRAATSDVGKAFVERKVFETSSENEALLEESRRISFYGFENLINVASHAFTGRRMKPEVGRIIAEKLKQFAARCKIKYGKGCPSDVAAKRGAEIRRISSERSEVRRDEIGTAISLAKKGKPLSAAHRQALRVKKTIGIHTYDSKTKWTEDRIREDALKYETRTAWGRQSGRAYHAAKERGILENVTVHMKKPWTTSSGLPVFQPTSVEGVVRKFMREQLRSHTRAASFMALTPV